MQISDKRWFIILFLVFISYFFCFQYSFAKNRDNHQSAHTVCKLNTGHYNGGILINPNNPIQLANYRVVKSVHFVKNFFFSLISVVVCLKYLKNNLKHINSEHARFLKRLLYPNHVFW